MTPMSPEQRDSWDYAYGMIQHQWKLYQCSDCDPDLMNDQEKDKLRASGESVYDEPAVIILPTYMERPDYCPRCQSYLSLDDGREVFVSTGDFRKDNW